jgi:hypothetical protein
MKLLFACQSLYFALRSSLRDTGPCSALCDKILCVYVDVYVVQLIGGERLAMDVQSVIGITVQFVIGIIGTIVLLFLSIRFIRRLQDRPNRFFLSLLSIIVCICAIVIFWGTIFAVNRGQLYLGPLPKPPYP